MCPGSDPYQKSETIALPEPRARIVQRPWKEPNMTGLIYQALTIPLRGLPFLDRNRGGVYFGSVDGERE